MDETKVLILKNGGKRMKNYVAIGEKMNAIKEEAYMNGYKI